MVLRPSRTLPSARGKMINFLPLNYQGTRLGGSPPSVWASSGRWRDLCLSFESSLLIGLAPSIALMQVPRKLPIR